MRTSLHTRKPAAGFALLEVLFAVLILSLGLIGLVGLQAVSAKYSTDAKYRSEASLLANQVLGSMWVGDRTIATLQTNYNTGGASYATWLASVAAMLPGVVADTPTAPTITVAADGTVTVAVFWRAPSDAASSAPHSLTTVAQIR